MTSAVRGRGVGPKADVVRRLRGFCTVSAPIADIGGRGSIISKILRTPFKYGPFEDLETCWKLLYSQVILIV